MNKCLYCYHKLEKGEIDFHLDCAKKFFGKVVAPQLPYSGKNMSGLAQKVIKTSTSITGVQSKMSLNIDRGKKNEPDKFTIVGLWGKYIFKPQSSKYKNLPELEDVTMKMAQSSKIKTASHTLIRMIDGELGYLTLRMDRGKKGEKISMLDMCQLSNRLTEHKYDGTYSQLAQTIKRYSSAPALDIQRFWEMVLFSWITGNSDMHCKNFSLIDIGNREYTLSPAYDLLPVLLVDKEDREEMALAFKTGGAKNGFNRATFFEAFTESGISNKIANNIIDRLCSNTAEWMQLIELSFLPSKTKQAYKALINKRISLLQQ